MDMDARIYCLYSTRWCRCATLVLVLSYSPLTLPPLLPPNPRRLAIQARLQAHIAVAGQHRAGPEAVPAVTSDQIAGLQKKVGEPSVHVYYMACHVMSCHVY